MVDSLFIVPEAANVGTVALEGNTARDSFLSIAKHITAAGIANKRDSVIGRIANSVMHNMRGMARTINARMRLLFEINLLVCRCLASSWKT